MENVPIFFMQAGLHGVKYQSMMGTILKQRLHTGISVHLTSQSLELKWVFCNARTRRKSDERRVLKVDQLSVSGTARVPFMQPLHSTDLERDCILF